MALPIPSLTVPFYLDLYALQRLGMHYHAHLELSEFTDNTQTFPVRSQWMNPKILLIFLVKGSYYVSVIRKLSNL